MSCKECKPMDERLRFVAHLLKVEQIILTTSKHRDHFRRRPSGHEKFRIDASNYG